MRKIVVLIAIVVLLAGSASVVLAKSKIWDLIFEEETQQQQQPESFLVEIKMAGGETFRIDTQEGNYDDVEFQGPMKIERSDGTYYINTAQVQYIRVSVK